jgi:hypothetical protein
MSVQTTLELHDLLRVLNAATDKNALRWNKTLDENSFRAEFGLGMVRIWRSDDSSPRFNLSLLDRDGTILDEYRLQGEDDLVEIEALFRKVRHQALDLGRKLKGVFDQLKKLAGES